MLRRLGIIDNNNIIIMKYTFASLMQANYWQKFQLISNNFIVAL